MAIDFDDSGMKALLHVRMVHTPRSQKDTVMDSWTFHNSFGLKCINEILHRFRCFMKEVVGIFRIFSFFFRALILVTEPIGWYIVMIISGAECGGKCSSSFF
jgi:hypothetical protein